MDVAEHLTSSLAAAFDLANAFGPSSRAGRPLPSRDSTAVRQTVETALRRATQRPPRFDEEGLDHLVGVCTRIWRVLDALPRGDHDQAATEVNGLLAETAARPVLVRHQEQPWHLHFCAPERSTAQQWAAHLSVAVAMLVGSEAAQRVRQCAASRCDSVFLDSTRAATQRYCTASCQNRAKVAAFRSRRRGIAGPSDVQ